ncbi:hypothetical protein J437_LFUL016608 [Ladona fulva]|uniref:HTH CENPB-type domain-containing protein n=1 Tax=Ladona fulva TaxID=123851 RepID=A0A8K0KQU4_LADFU|nr:hypothetical protein J437_LFUL016608 [Ladona fulva]
MVTIEKRLMLKLYFISMNKSFLAANNQRDRKRKRVVLSIIDKLKIIEKLETGTPTSQIVAEYGIGMSTVKDLKKNRDSLRKFALQFDPSMQATGLSARKTLKMANFKSLEEAVIKWYRQQRSAGEEIQGVDIQSAADRIAKELGIEKFNASSGWLSRFRNRHGIPNKIIHDGSPRIETANIDPFRENLCKLVNGARLQQFQIYTVSESVIRWRSLPERMLLLKQKPCLLKGVSKDTFAAMLCANADGSHKLNPVIVRNAGLRFPPNSWINQISIQYYTSDNGWFNQDLISYWFFHHFEPEVRSYQVKVLKIHPDAVKCLLVLEIAPWQSEVNELSSQDGKIRCFAFRSASELSESGIMAKTRRLYLKKFLNQVIAISDDSRNHAKDTLIQKSLENIECYSFRSAVYNWMDSWNELQPSAIEDATKMLLYNSDAEVDFEGLKDMDYHKILSVAGEQLTIRDVAVWLESEAEVHRQSTFFNGEIPQNAANAALCTTVDSNDSKAIKLPKLSFVRESIDFLLNFVDATDDSAFADYYEHLRNLQSLIILRQRQKVTKSNFHQFFSPSSDTVLFPNIPECSVSCTTLSSDSSNESKHKNFT